MKDGQPKPGPYVTLGAVVYDEEGQSAMLYRGANVRSVKNCWSLVTGLHEEGLTFDKQLANEIREEIGVAALGEPIKLGFYENIVTGEEHAYHWVIVMFLQKVAHLGHAVNKEPHKHDKIKVFHAYDLVQDSFFVEHPNWAPGMGEFLKEHRYDIVKRIHHLRNE